MQTGLKTKLDYADYCAIPPDGKRYELIAGEVHVTAAPSPSHQRLVQRFLRILEDHFRSPMEVLISPIDVVLTPHDVVQPDLVVVADSAQVSDRGIEGAPLIIVEVLSPATARFVPPPWEEVVRAFADLERFLHDLRPMPVLIKAGLAHAQFQTIHPFLDGNGRIGRLLITFWLVEQGVIARPILHPSLFFKENREEYIDRLQAIRDEGAWEDWLAFFVDGIGQVATEATTRALEIVGLREQHQGLISSRLGKRSPNALALLDHLFRQPILGAKGIEEALGVSQPTASALVQDLESIGLLREFTGRQRNRLFSYDRYLDLFPGAASRA